MASNGTPDNTPSALGRIGASLMGLAHTRMALIGIELAEEKERIVGALVIAAVAGVFGLVMLISLTALIVIALWDSYHWQPLLGLTVLYGIVTLACVLRLRYAARHAPPSFEATRAEFDNDRALVVHHLRGQDAD
ncbi:phage holin family protein [Robbsia sp. KACC 23696]|uniref:phage holin family protein n=1 Tax=Robbsia sp. KACC 23696 TaxID=3149231 RepID=UPI00325AD958